MNSIFEATAKVKSMTGNNRGSIIPDRPIDGSIRQYPSNRKRDLGDCVSMSISIGTGR
jgi:hypothetical protein